MDDVGKHPNLERRKAVYRCRMRCPQHLLREGVPFEKSVSLRTKDRAIALERLPAARQQIMEFFQRGGASSSAVAGIVRTVTPNRRPESSDLPFLTVGEAEELARRYFSAAREGLDLSSADNRYLSIEEREQRCNELHHLLARLEHPEDDEFDPVIETEIALLRQAGRRAPFQSEPSRRLRGYVHRALRQIWRIELARLNGDYADQVTDSLFVSSTAPLLIDRSGPPESTTTLGEALTRYEQELLAKGRVQKTVDRYRAEIEHIRAFFGPERRMSDLKRADCVAFRDAFALLPPNFTKRSKRADVHQIVAMRQAGDPVLAYATLTKYLAALSRFTRWAHQEDLLDKDYGEGLEPVGAKPDGSMSKLPFEPAELQRLFSRPIYTGCVNDGQGFSKVGPNIVRRARYWAPLIALFGGLRAGEIFQLTPNHFRVSDAGTAFIVLTKDMKLKNENAEREIPVHSALIKIGLLEWVERRRDQPEALLFSEIITDKYGSASSVFGKRFSSDLKHLALGERRQKLTFHSFRHTFKRALDREDISEQEKDELCGWARAKKTGRRYGIGLEADRLKRALELVPTYVDLELLSRHSKMVD